MSDLEINTNEENESTPAVEQNANVGSDLIEETENNADQNLEELSKKVPLKKQPSSKKIVIKQETTLLSNTDEVVLDQDEEEDAIISSDDEETPEVDNNITHYHELTQRELIKAFKTVLSTKNIPEIKDDIEEIKREFYIKFDEELNEKKEAFISQGGNSIDFKYTTELKNEFNTLFFEYREKRNHYYKNLKKDLQFNFEKRLALIEELKGLLAVEENINTTYKQFKSIQDRWREAGPIPRDRYNTVWNNYHHHVENFYDFLHLNREFRDLDFKHNLDQKLKIIMRAEELAKETDTDRSFRELQMLHKIWKEETGPVEKSYRDEIWERFSAATKLIHDKRSEYLGEIEKEFENNLLIKNDIINQIKALSENPENNHKSWQNNIQKLEKFIFKNR